MIQCVRSCRPTKYDSAVVLYVDDRLLVCAAAVFIKDLDWLKLTARYSSLN